MPVDKDVLIDLRDASLSYVREHQRVSVLENLSLRIARAETCAIVGKSGSGKTTLMHVLGLLHRPTCGTYQFNGLQTSAATADELASVRNQQIGFVFQSFHLLPRLSALDNVALPLFYRGLGQRERRARALAHLQRLGLSDRAQHRPAELSGGQCQRVAIARALVTDPTLILADEPTGNLDQGSAGDILALLLEVSRRAATTVVIVTHDPLIARRCKRQFEVVEGRLRETSRTVDGSDASIQ